MAVRATQAASGTVGMLEQQHPTKKQQQHFSSITQLVSGGVAGAISKTCTAPLARLTILFQVRSMTPELAGLGKPSMFSEAERIVREEGIKAFWKGNGVTVVHRLPYSAINFFSYEQYKSAMLNHVFTAEQHDSEAVKTITRLVAGGASGVTAAAATYPLDLVRTRLAVETTSRHYKGIVRSLICIQKQEGFVGLYKGLWPTLLCVGPTIALNFSVYEQLHSYWLSRRPESSRLATSLVCGGVSGIVASTATFPIDLVKRRMQLQGDARWMPTYKPGIGGTMRHIIRTEGYRGLYRGILPEYFKVFPGVGIAFMIYEFMKNVVQR